MSAVKKIVTFLCQSWVIALLVMLLTNLLIWCILPQFSFQGKALLAQPSHRWLAIIILLAIWGLFNLTLALRKHKDNQKLYASEAKPELQTLDTKTDAQILEENWQLLSELGQHHAKQFIMFGAKGAGKSELLLQANIKALELSTLSQNSISTFCRWYNSNHGAFLEFDDEQLLEKPELWQTYLTFFRSTQQLAGIIICINVVDLLPVHSISQYVQYYKRWLTQLSQNQNMQLPIYIMLTQVDRLLGFEELFQTFTAEEVKQVVSFKLDHTSTLISQFEHWLNKFQRLALAKLGHIEQPESARRALRFPQQLTMIKTGLLNQLKELLNPINQKNQLSIYGVFLSSAMQTHDPIAPFHEQIAKKLAAVSSAITSPTTRTKPYFLTQFFTEVILDGQQVIPLNSAIKQKQVFQNLGYIVISFIACVIIYIDFKSYWLNREDLSKTTALLKEYQYIAKPTQYLVEAVPSLMQLWSICLYLDQSKQVLSKHWGLYSQREILETAKQKFLEQLNYYYNSAISNALGEQLAEVNNSQLRQALVSYFMLSKQRPMQVDRIQQWFKSYLENSLQAWRNLWPQLEQLFALYVANQPQLEPLDSKLVDNARQRLLPNSWQEEMYIEWEKLTQSVQQQKLTLLYENWHFQEIFVSKQPRINLPLLYTQEILTHQVPTWLANIKQTVLFDNDLLAPAERLSDAQLQSLVQSLEFDYLNRYIQAWQQYLTNLEVVSLTSLVQAQQVISTLAQANSPLEQLLKQITMNTELDDKLLANQAAVVINPAFAPFNELLQPKSVRGQQYLALKQNLASLAANLNDILSASNPTKTSYEAAKLQIQASDGSLYQKLLSQASNMPKPVSIWLTSIITQTWQQQLIMAAAYLNQEWKKQVYEYYQQNLASYYPLSPNASQEVNLDIFRQFFAKDGIFDQYIQNYLTLFISKTDLQGITYYGATLPFSKSSVQQLQDVRQIQTMFFDQSGQNLRAQLILMPYLLSDNASRLQLRILGKQLTYEHGPQQLTQLSWPSEDLNVAIQFTDLQGQIHLQNLQGNWAWFHLLNGNILHVDNIDSMSSKIELQAGPCKASYLVSFANGTNPLKLISKGIILPTNLFQTN